MTDTRRGCEGATLIELLVGMAIMAMLLVLITRFFASQNKTYSTQADIAELQQGMRVVMELMSREARKAGLDVRGVGFAGTTLDSTRLEVWADLNNDGDTADMGEHYTYYLSAGDSTLRRTVYEAGAQKADDEVLDNVELFRIQHLTSSGLPAPNASQVRQIRITLAARSRRMSSARRTADGMYRDTLRFTVTPPNLAL